MNKKNRLTSLTSLFFVSSAALFVGCGDDSRGGDMDDAVNAVPPTVPDGNDPFSNPQVGDDDDAILADVVEFNGDADFSFIWIANSPESTLSKVDTQTLVEVARYATGGDEPSRTSVNLNGDAVVANRGPAGGIAKYINSMDQCATNNKGGQDGLQTSTGKEDVLAWGADDCLHWFFDAPGVSSNRPAAWTTGALDQSTGNFVGTQLWTSVTDASGHRVLLLDGDTGTIDEETVIDFTGHPYGGAVDENGDFWMISRSGDFGVVRFGTMDFENIDAGIGGSYGIAVGPDQTIWIAPDRDNGLTHYNPATGAVSFVPPARDTLGHGLMVDRENRVWVSGSWNNLKPFWLVGVDGDSETMFGDWDVSGLGANAPDARGISIDFEGYVWFVDTVDTAYKFDPDTQTVVGSYDGLNSPYTYSDMTGYGLSVATPNIPVL